MTCQERRDSILIHALSDSDADALSQPERESIRSHLAGGCPACNAALAEAEATLAQIPLSLKIESPPSQARDRIMQRVLAHLRQAQSSALQPGNALRNLLALAACLAIGFGASYYAMKPRYDAQLATRDAQIASRETQLANSSEQLATRDAQLQKSNTELATRDQRISQLMSQSTSDQDMLKILQAENLQMVSLNKAEPQPNARGRLIWDRDRDMWHVSVFDMKPPEPGQTFELWYITPDQRKIAAGTFDVDAKGNGSIMVKLPKDIGPVAIAAITNEPMGGVDQPTGKIHLLVDFSKAN